MPSEFSPTPHDNDLYNMLEMTLNPSTLTWIFRAFHLPHEYMCIVASLSVESAPPYALSIYSEILGHPEYWVWGSSGLSLTEFSIKESGCGERTIQFTMLFSGT